MVSRSPDDYPSCPPAQPKASLEKTVHTVLVPVFLRVRLPAEDDLQAEVEAVDAVRALAACHIPGKQAVIQVASVIHPISERPHTSS
jgi:hypothetical protein